MKTLILSLIFLVGICQANISYTIETRKLTSKPAGDDLTYAENLKQAFKSAPQPSGYCTAKDVPFPLENSSLCGSNQNIAWKFTFNFVDSQDANYQIRFGTDFGWGAAVFVNQEFQFARTDDLWWAGNWNSGDVFVLDYDFQAGRNQVTVWGAEGCCDGQMNVQFNRDGAGFQDFNIENLENTIPQPYPGYHEPSDEFEVIVDSRYATGKVGGEGINFGGNLAEQFDNSDITSGYCDEVHDPSWPIENSNTCDGGNENIAWRFIFNFYNPFQSTWHWEFGTDFGRGFALYANGNFHQAGTDDYWWAGNWNSGDVFRQSFHFKAGWNQVVVYGSEGCCDGITDVRFSVDGQPWLRPTIDNFEYVAGKLGKGDSVAYDIFVDIESRFSDKAPQGYNEYTFARSLHNQFENAPNRSGYCRIEDVSYPFENSSSCGSNQNIAWRFVFNWYVGAPAEYEFEFGLDFGRGFAVWVDGNLESVEANDLWWAGNWSSGAVQHISGPFDVGYHSVIVYGSEGCCDGAQAVRFAVNGGDWQEANFENLFSQGGNNLVQKSHKIQNKSHSHSRRHLNKHNRHHRR